MQTIEASFKLMCCDQLGLCCLKNSQRSRCLLRKKENDNVLSKDRKFNIQGNVQTVAINLGCVVSRAVNVPDAYLKKKTTENDNVLSHGKFNIEGNTSSVVQLSHFRVPHSAGHNLRWPQQTLTRVAARRSSSVEQKLCQTALSEHPFGHVTHCLSIATCSTSQRIGSCFHYGLCNLFKTKSLLIVNKQTILFKEPCTVSYLKMNKSK